jgi:hypothetical protein
MSRLQAYARAGAATLLLAVKFVCPLLTSSDSSTCKFLKKILRQGLSCPREFCSSVSEITKFSVPSFNEGLPFEFPNLSFHFPLFNELALVSLFSPSPETQLNFYQSAVSIDAERH